MAEEVELKLALAEDHQARFLRHPLLKQALARHVDTLDNIYYDTADLSLRQRGIALRLRRKGRDWLQTVKLAGSSAGGLSSRPEWETPYSGHFDFSAIDAVSVREWLQRPKLLARIIPICETRFRRISWREGVAEPLASRFARVRVRAASRDQPRAEEWLLIEWPLGEPEPTHYWLATLPEESSFKTLVATAKARWLIERDYLELKQEVGLSHYEGRNWRGFHHHASLCIAAYGFLMLERLSGAKKNSARLKTPALPKGFHPRGSRADAAPHPLVHRHHVPSAGARHRPQPSAVPLLRLAQPQCEKSFLTQ